MGYHRGHPNNPIADSEVADKFRLLAKGLITEQQAPEIIERVWRLDEEKSLDSLLDLTKV